MSNFQSRASKQGQSFEDMVETMLLIEGFDIIDKKWRHPEVDIEIDFVVERSDLGIVWIECKGSWEGVRPGTKRTDTLKKAIGSGALLRLASDARPYWIITSHLPSAGAGVRWIEVAEGVYFDRIIETSRFQ